jgi:hypothetical protein
VARAKQTARADARRRTRQATRAAEIDLEREDLDDVDGADEADAASAGTAASRATATQGGRREIPRRPAFGSLFSSFGTAYRRPNVREDLRYMPSLLVSRGFLAAIALVLTGAILLAIFPGYSGSTFAFQFLTFPPALAPIFVAGFFAPRGSYLLGLAVVLFDAIVYSVWLIAALPSLGAGANPSDVGFYVLTALFWSAVTGIVFGAGAAWYRRFLQATRPRRQAQAGKGLWGRNQGGRRAATATSGRRRY